MRWQSYDFSLKKENFGIIKRVRFDVYRFLYGFTLGLLNVPRSEVSKKQR